MKSIYILTYILFPPISGGNAARIQCKYIRFKYKPFRRTVSVKPIVASRWVFEGVDLLLDRFVERLLTFQNHYLEGKLTFGDLFQESVVLEPLPL